MSNWLEIDFETRSDLDLKKVGIFKYAESRHTDVWCMSYAFDDEPVQRWLPGQDLPHRVGEHIMAGGRMRAWNAQFEDNIWAMLCRRDPELWPIVRHDQWVCSAALAARCGLPRRLEDCAKVLGLPVQKDMAGNRLAIQMSKPRKILEDGTIVWWDEEEKLERLYAYCDSDVVTQREVFKALPPVGDPTERKIWLLDQAINRRGVLIDRPVVESAIVLAHRATKKLDAQMVEVTDGAVEKISQAARLTAWAAAKGVTITVENDDGEDATVPVNSLAKAILRDLLKTALPAEVRTALLLRQEGAKTSVAKLGKMLQMVCADDKLRGMLLYHGAGTGRWSGRGVQLHNFPKGTIKITERLVDLVVGRKEALLDVLCSVPELIASMLRGCLIASPGHDLIVVDYAAVEARGVGWLAGCTKMCDQFRSGAKMYEEMASVIYRRPAAEITKESTERFVAKTVVLGAGYQIGWEKFQAQVQTMTGMDLDDELCQKAIKGYRDLYFEVPQLWRGMNSTCLHVVANRIERWVPVEQSGGKIAFCVQGGWLRMRLPSGRSLWYARPRVSQRKAPWIDERTGLPAMVPSVTVEGVDSTTKQWRRYALYGGLLTENAVQAICRDLMATAMLALEQAGYPLILTVHDEIVAEPVEGFGSVEEFIGIMTAVPDWAAGFPIAAEGWRGTRYRK